MPDEPTIFISYRRREGWYARHLHEYLSGRFGDDRVFFDRSTIESGDVFPDTLRRGVEALIGPEWLDMRGDDGARRLDDPEDFVARKSGWRSNRARRSFPSCSTTLLFRRASNYPIRLRPWRAAMC